MVRERKAATLFPIITQHTAEEVVVHTDDFSGYKKLHKAVAGHHTFQQSKKEYVHGDTHTQTIDGHWSIIKRSKRGLTRG